MAHEKTDIVVLRKEAENSTTVFIRRGMGELVSVRR